MKKFVLATVLMLFGCAQMSSIDVLPSMGSVKEQNPNCMDMRRFKVFQVFEDSYALANACTAEYDENFCIGAVVLLTPQRNIEYYDEMYVSTPDNKCAIQDGVFKYETKNKTHKTVPVIRFDYEFSSSSEEEDLERFYDKMEDVRYECKLSVINNKKQNTKANINKCDCVVDFITAEFVNLKDKTAAEREKFEKEFSKKLEKKCGKIPDFMKE